MIRAALCWLGLHRWRYCKRAVWDLEHVRMTLDLSACACCGVVRKDDGDQLGYLAGVSSCAVAIVDVIEVGV